MNNKESNETSLDNEEIKKKYQVNLLNLCNGFLGKIRSDIDNDIKENLRHLIELEKDPESFLSKSILESILFITEARIKLMQASVHIDKILLEINKDE